MNIIKNKLIQKKTQKEKGGINKKKWKSMVNSKIKITLKKTISNHNQCNVKFQKDKLKETTIYLLLIKTFKGEIENKV